MKALLDERGRTAPLAQLESSPGNFAYVPAVSGLAVGSHIAVGVGAAPSNGNILPMNRIPEGTRISNIELRAGDGGKLVRASGSSAILFSKGNGKAIIRLPSGKSILVDEKCRATIGQVAGGGRLEKPFMRAGPRYHAMQAAGRPYPRMRGIAMAVVYHPFGEAATSIPASRPALPGTRHPAGRWGSWLLGRRAGRDWRGRAPAWRSEVDAEGVQVPG